MPNIISNDVFRSLVAEPELSQMQVELRNLTGKYTLPVVIRLMRNKQKSKQVPKDWWSNADRVRTLVRGKMPHPNQKAVG